MMLDMYALLLSKQEREKGRNILSVIFMAPTSKKLRGHIGLGLSVQSSL